MANTPITRAEFLKILAAGSAGVLFLGGAEEVLAGITGTNDALDQAALDGDARAAHAAGTVLAVAKGTSASSNVQRAIAAVGGMRRFVHTGDTVVIKPNICATRAPQFAATTSTVRQHRPDPAGLGLGQDTGLSELALPVPALLRQNMTQTQLLELHLAGGGQVIALRGALSGLHFGHDSHLSYFLFFGVMTIDMNRPSILGGLSIR